MREHSLEPGAQRQPYHENHGRNTWREHGQNSHHGYEDELRSDAGPVMLHRNSYCSERQHYDADRGTENRAVESRQGSPWLNRNRAVETDSRDSDTCRKRQMRPDPEPK